MEDKGFQPEKLADQVAEKVIELLGNTSPVKRIRNSQLISAILGVLGFALFIAGVEKFFSSLTPFISIIVGIILMAVAGVLFQKLSK